MRRKHIKIGRNIFFIEERKTPREEKSNNVPTDEDEDCSFDDSDDAMEKLNLLDML